MKQPIKLIFDLDDTLNLLCAYWLLLINAAFSTSYTLADIKSWAEPLGKKEYQELLRNEPGLFAKLPENPGMIELLTRLHEMGYDIIICSAGHPKVAADKDAWIKEKLPWLPVKNIFFGARKELLASPDRWLIDDAQHNYTDFIAAGGHAILIDKPWNRMAEDGKPFEAVRAASTDELFHKIQMATEVALMEQHRKKGA